jgi:methyltransferase (TIGR00027 family)
MQEGRFSRTANSVAIRRAAHQLLDHPKVLDDPLALSIIDAEAAQGLCTDPHNQQSAFARAFRAFLVARGRYAEDQLAKAIAQDVNQYVVLGAGLDTFAYRNPHRNLRVFEVDHPATQAWKRQRLAEAKIEVPPTVTFVPVDFEHQTLASALDLAGLTPNAPAFFSWLGVIPYITRESCMSTLAFIARMPSGSGVAFDFAIDPQLLDWKGRLALKALSARVALSGEPFRLFFRPEELESELKHLGFGEIEILAGDEINTRYFRDCDSQDRADGLRVSGNIGRLACAWVAEAKH